MSKTKQQPRVRHFCDALDGSVVVLLSDSGMDIFEAAMVDQRRHVFTEAEARNLAADLIDAANAIAKSVKP